MTMNHAVDGHSVNPETRQLTTAYIPREPKTVWIYNRMDKVFFKTASYWISGPLLR